MAEALVGGAFLSGFINVVFDRLLSPEAVNLVLGKKLDQELVERLKAALCAADALLADAERKQMGNKPVKDWVDSLKDAVYKADDFLDRVFTEAATQKEVCTLRLNAPQCFQCFRDFRDTVLVNKMEEVVRKIEDLEKRRYILGLNVIPKDNNNSSWRIPSTSMLKGNIYGREDDQEAMLKILNESSDDQLSVIPIVGMGGVGKTTLAQWLYNNEGLMKGFDVKAWVCISEEFDVVEITKTITEGISSSTCTLKDFNSLQYDLKEKLSEKKFFVVLDDVWSEDGDSWNTFKTPFQYGAKGSKIIVTTRSKEVASVVRTCSPYFLDELSEDYCWSVFMDNACFLESNRNSLLEEIGRKIVKKCKGLPLAAETLGRLLRGKHDVQEWDSVLMSDVWEFPVKSSKIIPALLISYYHLPAYLKRCFVYCSLFPKDYRFDKDELILLWMAEDLLRPPKRGETFEVVGSECFDDLTSRLFFKQLRNDKSFVMHDLLHDLAMFLAGDFYFRLEELGKVEEIRMQTRHLSYGSLSHPISKEIYSDDRVEFLRTLLRVNFLAPSFSIESAASVLISKLKYLRVLSFRSFHKLDALPDSIGELIHLRYLNLSMTRIKTLPESLCDLYNLQTLKLSYCDELTRLPKGMHNLVNLRHLDIWETSLEEMPGGMGKLKHLQVLRYFVVGRHKDNGIKELGGLSNLHGSLEIRKLENVANSDEAMGARIKDKMHIDKLHLKWSSSGDTVLDTQTEADILDKLQPHNGLKELRIKRYSGTRFPNWVGHSSYHNMTHVNLVSCRNCFMLPSLGQLQCLKSLQIEDFNSLESIGDEFYKNEDDHPSYVATTKPFPSLVELSFRNMPRWKVWDSFDTQAFPLLKSFKIRDCPRFTGNLPDHLPALETLEIQGCQQFVSTLPRAPAIHKLEIYGTGEVGFRFCWGTFSIRGCQMVPPMIFGHQTCLQVLKISCLSIDVSLQGNCLPKSLKTLIIINCRKLEFPKLLQQKHDLLEELYIYGSCDSLTSLPLEVFPCLKTVSIRECENLESISAPQSQLAALHELDIDGCPNFESFPREGLHAPNMTYFGVFWCDKLKSLPCHMSTLVPNLERLEIWDSPEVDSFPEGGLPPNLKSLDLRNCEKLLSSLSSLGVVEALTHLTIVGCEGVKSIPKEGLLPLLPSLSTLRLWIFPRLETLECKELHHLTSLQLLEIRWCPELENMAGERLPASLSEFVIDRCPLLAERCKMKHPQIWPKISHIPDIKVDGRQVL